MNFRESVYAELREVVGGLKKGRETDNERIVFISIGTEVEDSAVANLVYKRALEQKLGTTLKFL